MYLTAFKKNDTKPTTGDLSPVVSGNIPEFNEDSFLSPSSFLMSPKMTRSPDIGHFNHTKSPDTTTFSGAELHSVTKKDVFIQTLTVSCPQMESLPVHTLTTIQDTFKERESMINKMNQLEIQLENEKNKNQELEIKIQDLQRRLESLNPINDKVNHSRSQINLNMLIQNAEKTLEETLQFLDKL